MPSERTESRIAQAQRDRSAGAVEGGQHAVAGRVHQSAAEALDLAREQRIMRAEQFLPAAVAYPGRVLRGADDVGVQDRGQHAV